MLRDIVNSEQRQTRLGLDGKFFLRDGKRISINAVTYGPFPEYNKPASHAEEMAKIAKSGFNSIRIYDEPSTNLLDAALAHGVMVFAGTYWPWNRAFRGIGAERFFTEAKLRTAEFLNKWAAHPALVGYYIANEIPSDIARWMGPVATRNSLHELIDLCHEIAPQLLTGYANYPSSEYLEPENADFTGFNIYLEDEEKFSNYLARLHHLSGDRPVLLSELGLDSKHHGEQKQAEVLGWSRRRALAAGMAGTTIFAWSDSWQVAGKEVTDWDFGITDRNFQDKPALETLTEINQQEWSPALNLTETPKISVIICVYNGVDRVWKAIESLENQSYPNYEVIVVDDGSNDGTTELLERYADSVTVVQAQHGGLSNARNIGAKTATGDIFAYTDDDCEVDQDWLSWIARGYAEQNVDAMGGPNIPPTPQDEDEAVVAASLGAPSHILLNDTEAEHIPGCNLTVTRKAFEAIGGFHETYRVAGDDVDFCWRLEAAGFKIGFHGAAFVWHRRRTSVYRYFKQQKGYGKAEALLMRDHPEKFTRGHGAKWKGCVYTGAALGAQNGSFIYHGEAGSGAYQQVVTHMMPQRPLHPRFRNKMALWKLRLTQWLQPKVRKWSRWYYSRDWVKTIEKAEKQKTSSPVTPVNKTKESQIFCASFTARSHVIEALLTRGWHADHGYSEWDLTKEDQKLLIAQESVGDQLWNIRIRLLKDSPQSISKSITREIERLIDQLDKSNHIT